ncbi:hypothetical protein [Micromonospora fulviviridis]|uniref:hypothetical protein n=1 Tax=Micromonospora fulviviridis TaxID=47860 RepID=UPI0037B5784A
MTEEQGFPKPDESQLLSALKKTGFLLEQRVAQLLQSKNLVAEPNAAFTDPETGKTREVDVIAYFDATAGDGATFAPYIFAELLIECKNTPNPFVLVGREERKPGGTYTYWAEFDPLTLKFGNQYRWTNYQLKFSSLPGSAADAGFIGSQLLRLDRQSGNWRASNDGVYDSIVYPLAKAQVWRYGEDMVETGRAEELGNPCFNFLYPVLVTTGPVFTVTVDKAETRVREVDWAPLARDFRQEGLDGTAFLEVVRFDKLEEYLDQRFFGYLNEIKRTLIENARLFDPDWLVKNLGEPGKQELFDAWLANRAKG